MICSKCNYIVHYTKNENYQDEITSDACACVTFTNKGYVYSKYKPNKRIIIDTATLLKQFQTKYLLYKCKKNMFVTKLCQTSLQLEQVSVLHSQSYFAPQHDELISINSITRKALHASSPGTDTELDFSLLFAYTQYRIVSNGN